MYQNNLFLQYIMYMHQYSSDHAAELSSAHLHCRKFDLP